MNKNMNGVSAKRVHVESYRENERERCICDRTTVMGIWDAVIIIQGLVQRIYLWGLHLGWPDACTHCWGNRNTCSTRWKTTQILQSLSPSPVGCDGSCHLLLLVTGCTVQHSSEIYLWKTSSMGVLWVLNGDTIRRHRDGCLASSLCVI